MSLTYEVSGRIHTRSVRFEESGLRRWKYGSPANHSRGNGADDETTRRVIEGDGEEDHLVGGRGDHRGE